MCLFSLGLYNVELNSALKCEGVNRCDVFHVPWIRQRQEFDNSARFSEQFC